MEGKGEEGGGKYEKEVVSERKWKKRENVGEVRTGGCVSETFLGHLKAIYTRIELIHVLYSLSGGDSVEMIEFLCSQHFIHIQFNIINIRKEFKLS